MEGAELFDLMGELELFGMRNAYAQNVSRAKKVKLPEGNQQYFDVCRRFLDEHAR